MSTHLAMRSGNPVLTAETFGARAHGAEDRMTITGTVNKTALALVVLLVTAMWSWSLGPTDPRIGVLTLVGALGGLAVAIVTVVKRPWAPVTTPLYAALEGLVLGSVSVVLEARYPGIVSQAVLLTVGTLAAMLAAYRSGLIRPTEHLKLGIVAATGAIAVVYVLSMVLGLFGVGVPLIYGSGPVGIAFSVVVVCIAAFNLVLDFDFIESGSERGAPKYMEWYAAFGLLVTLVWLYLEILRLLTKLNERQ
jgi:uncharacterized YccA/Bax inhibitor family protein